MGVTLGSIDRMLAEVDRVLAGPRSMPVGGPVKPVPEANFCWKDSESPIHPGHVRPCGTLLPYGWELTMGLCPPHYLELVVDA